MVIMGHDEIRRWTALISLSGDSEKPSELTRQVLLTARLCELVAKEHSIVPSTSAFMMGLLSGLDALLDIERETVLSHISISDELVDAIVQGAGEHGRLLVSVEKFIRGEWEAFDESDEFLFYHRHYIESLKWVDDTMQTMKLSAVN